MTIKKYFKELATGNEVSSLRKFVTLIVTGIFLITQVLIVFFCFYLILTETNSGGTLTLVASSTNDGNI